MKRVADEAVHRACKTADQLGGAINDCLEYRLRVRWRAGNDFEDVCGPLAQSPFGLSRCLPCRPSLNAAPCPPPKVQRQHLIELNHPSGRDRLLLVAGYPVATDVSIGSRLCEKAVNDMIL